LTTAQSVPAVVAIYTEVLINKVIIGRAMAMNTGKSVQDKVVSMFLLTPKMVVHLILEKKASTAPVAKFVRCLLKRHLPLVINA
jgi:hypothetical protein